MYEENISIKPYLNEYININPLKNYELNWLFALLFIPYIKYNNNQIDNIDSLMNSLKYLSYISSIHDYLYTNSPS